MLLKHRRSWPREGSQQLGTSCLLTSPGHRAETSEGQADCTVCPVIIEHGAARQSRDLKFTAVLQYVSVELLTSSFYKLKKNAAIGVDQMTWHEYEKDLEDRIVDLHGRVHRGAYRAKPSRRVHIPKPDSRTRPLGIASLEDKIVQHAVRTVLQCIYEEDFLGFSYGFRPNRSAHDALDALAYAIPEQRVG